MLGAWELCLLIIIYACYIDKGIDDYYYAGVCQYEIRLYTVAWLDFLHTNLHPNRGLGSWLIEILSHPIVDDHCW